MANHIFINEEKFFHKIKPSKYYLKSNMVKSYINNFLYFVTVHHLSEQKEHIKQLSNKQYSCTMEFDDEYHNRIQCGIKYNELSDHKLQIIFVYFDKKT